MNDEIKEILDNPKILMLSYGNYISLDDYVELKDYITNLQEEVKSANESITWWTNRYKALQNRNIELVLERDRLKENNNAMQEEMTMTWKKLDKVKGCIKDFLCTEEYCKLEGKAIADNYMKLLSIVGGDE